MDITIDIPRKYATHKYPPFIIGGRFTMKNNRSFLPWAAAISAVLCAVCAFLLPALDQRMETLKTDMDALFFFLYP